MPSDKPYILFCAGEDSGDCIGQALVRECVKILPQVEILGAGGIRMQSAGLKPVVDFEVLPVSGFGDVLPRYFKLRRCYNALKSALKSPRCLGLVAIDYPGFNMKLVSLASKLGKPALYVAPPQAWAWKSKRARTLSRLSKVELAVFFDFEKSVYENAGCNVETVEHPFVGNVLGEDLEFNQSSDTKDLLLLPGSRIRQCLRNLPAYMKIAKNVVECRDAKISILAARQSVADAMNVYLQNKVCPDLRSKVKVVVSPQNGEDRLRLYRKAFAAISAPGTATLELALAGCPTVVCAKPDFLTYHLVKRSVRTRFFALPNIILDEKVFPEFLQLDFPDEDCLCVASELVNEKCQFPVGKLVKRLSSGMKSSELMSEFLAQFV